LPRRRLGNRSSVRKLGQRGRAAHPRSARTIVWPTVMFRSAPSFRYFLRLVPRPRSSRADFVIELKSQCPSHARGIPQMPSSAPAVFPGGAGTAVLLHSSTSPYEALQGRLRLPAIPEPAVSMNRVQPSRATGYRICSRLRRRFRNTSEKRFVGASTRANSDERLRFGSDGHGLNRETGAGPF